MILKISQITLAIAIQELKLPNTSYCNALTTSYYAHMLNNVKSILDRNNIDFDTINQVNLLLYGYKTLNYSENHEIIELTVKFISLSGRFT